MLKHFRRNLTYGNVMATIAVFLALTGGYAVAFSGSGSLQKAGKIGLESGQQFVDMRTVTGIGAIGVQCSDFPPGGSKLSLRNNSGKTLALMGTLSDDDDNGFVEPFRREYPSNNSYDPQFLGFTLGLGPRRYSAHIAPVNGTKRPQADIEITVNFTGNCVTSYIEVLALNTEQ